MFPSRRSEFRTVSRNSVRSFGISVWVTGAIRSGIPDPVQVELDRGLVGEDPAEAGPGAVGQGGGERGRLARADRSRDEDQAVEREEGREEVQDEFAALDALLSARKNAGLTQEEVASRMGMSQPALARIESSLGSRKHSPSLETLRKYARACGKRLEIKIV